MGKKTTGRLAGLAALAAAAYMYKNKDKDKDAASGKETPAPETAPVAKPEEKPEEAAVDSGDFLSRRLNRLDTDDGKLYSTNNLSPMSSPAKVARAEKAPSGPAAKPPAAKPYVPFSRTQVTPDAKREAEQEKLMSAYKPRRPDTKLKDTKFTTKSGNKTITTTPYADEELKRGGRVKKMASGGMTSKRGDGIASKGRTRCKMY